MSLLPFDVPVDPGRDEARRLLEEELAKSRYQDQPVAERPSWLDDLFDWFDQLMNSLGGENTAPGWVVVLVIVGIAVLVVAFLVCGLMVSAAWGRDGLDVDLALLIGVLGFLGTVTVARFIERRGS